MPSVELAVISVAGIGSRLGLNLPKCLVTIAGRTLIARQLELLRDVPEIRVVVGFKEEEVVEEVSRLRDDVIFVRNRNYDRTSTLQSIYLAVRSWHGSFLAVEGDVIFEPTAFAHFLAQGDSPGLLSVTPTITDDALCVATSSAEDGGLTIHNFQRTPRTAYEWSGLATLHSSWIENKNTFAYEAMIPHLPLRGVPVPAFEIDTPADLDRAHHFVRSGGWDAADRAAIADVRFGIRREPTETSVARALDGV